MIAWIALALAAIALTLLAAVTIAVAVIARKAKPMLAMFAPKK